MHSFSLPRFWFSTIAAMSLAFSSSICGQEKEGKAACLGGSVAAQAGGGAPPRPAPAADCHHVGRSRTCCISTVVSMRCCCCCWGAALIFGLPLPLAERLCTV